MRFVLELTETAEEDLIKLKKDAGLQKRYKAVSKPLILLEQRSGTSQRKHPQRSTPSNQKKRTYTKKKKNAPKRDSKKTNKPASAKTKKTFKPKQNRKP